MSGPWDRPSPDPNAEWPTEDRESPGPAEPAQPEVDPWSSGDLWPETPREASQEWDDWPSTVPPDDDAIEEPEPTLSDPWAEAWTDEAAGQPPGAGADRLPERQAWPSEPEPESRWRPGPEPHPEPEPPPEPVRGPRQAWRPEPETPSAPPPWEPPAPRVEPWRPDSDPWAAIMPEPTAGDEPAEEPWPVADAEPAHEAGGEADAARAAEGADDGLAADASPARAAAPLPPLDWLPEPEPEPAEPEPQPEPAEPEPEPEPAEPEPQPEPAEPEPEPEPERAAAEVQFPAYDAAWSPGQSGEPSPPTPSPWGAEVAQPLGPVEEPAALQEEADGADQADDRPGVEAAAPGIASEEEAGPWAAPRLGWGADDERAAPAESTQVLPTSWEPPPPPPPASAGDARLEAVAGEARTRLAQPDIEVGEDLEAQPSTAEQAVPWLIGFILLLAGMVIVLLALIFAGDDSLGGAASPPPNVAALVTRSPAPTPTPAPVTPSPSSAPTAVATPTPVPAPEYGSLEMVYQGRSTALKPIYLLWRDFTVLEERDPRARDPLAQDPKLDIRRFAWAPDGTVGVGLYEDVLVSIEPGVKKRWLGEGITAITFGDDASVVYAVRVTQDGANDVANILAVDFESGEPTELATITYARPDLAVEPALREAQFADDGGAIRLYWMADDVLRLWSLGGGSWTIDPDDRAVQELEEALPVLWAPGGQRRISVSAAEGTSTISLLDVGGDTVASTTAEGLVSHLRWSPDGRRVVFTLGRSASGGGVLQDLFLWDLGDGVAPVPLTYTGAAFGAEWLGSKSLWRE